MEKLTIQNLSFSSLCLYTFLNTSFLIQWSRHFRLRIRTVMEYLRWYSKRQLECSELKLAGTVQSNYYV